MKIWWNNLGRILSFKPSNKKTLPVYKQRQCDKWGCGYFGARRAGGKRTHKGVDLVMEVGEEMISHVSGVVTKLGYPYADDLSFRYVRINDGVLTHDFFYIEPYVSVGDEIDKGTKLGTLQKLGDRYKGITEHCHYQVRDDNGLFLDPNDYIVTQED